MVKIAITQYKDLTRWDVKSQTIQTLTSFYPLVKIGDLLQNIRNPVFIQNHKEYKQVTVKLYNKGVIERGRLLGARILTKSQNIVLVGQFIISKIDGKDGAFGLIPKDLDGAIVTNDFPIFESKDSKILDLEYFNLLLSFDESRELLQKTSVGTTGRKRLQIPTFLELKIPLPPLKQQQKIIAIWQKAQKENQDHLTKAGQLKNDIDSYLLSELGITIHKQEKAKVFTTMFKDLERWSLQYIATKHKYTSIYPLVSLQDSQYSTVIQRGFSPKYAYSEKYILNQQCNRWDEINLNFVKTVDPVWLDSIEKNKFTQIDDIIINSTGEGTIGRASKITEKSQGLMYDSHMLLIRLKGIQASFFIEIFNSDIGQNQVNTIKSAQSTKQTELGVENLKKIQIPLPSMEMQEKIVEHISSLRTEITKLQEQASTIISDTREIIKNLIIS